MAVDASHIAFLYLGKHARPPPADDQPTDLSELLHPIAVIELEDDGILDPTINTGM
jgi:hypothetical protein